MERKWKKTNTAFGKLIFFILQLTLLAYSGLAQEGYTSHNNYSGSWGSDASWIRSAPWLKSIPGTNLGGSTAYVNVNGYISLSTNLTIAGSSELNVNDTLWVFGDVEVKGGGQLNVADTGLLIIAGSLDASGGALTINNGRIVVMGDLSATGGADVDNNSSGTNGFYVYGNISRNGGAQFNGSNNPAAGNFMSESGLYNDDPDLATFINGVLPVTLLWAEANYQYDDVLIKWATASEINNEKFYIERSYDGRFFETIGQVAGSGNSNVEETYQFIDFTKNSLQDAYYRLKQVDFDGKFEYSAIFAVNGKEEKLSMEIFPNPTTDKVFIRVRSTSLRITLTSITGVILLNNEYDHNEQSTFEIDLSAFPQGTYVLSVSDGDFAFAERVIKQ